MLSLRTVALAASALFFAVSTSAAADVEQALGAGFPRVQRAGARALALSGSRSLKSRSLHRRTDPLTELQSILTNLATVISPITADITSIVKDSGTSDQETTTSSLNDSYSSLEEALNVATEGVTKLAGQIKGDVDLTNLAQTIVSVILDLEAALATVEAGISIDPALAPLITALGGILNGPLVSLLTALTGLLSGLLPVVQGLLAGLGLTPLLVSLQGTVDGLLTALGL